MKEKRDSYDVGVIVGRFQVPELHAAHRALIDHVMERHRNVVIMLGLSPLLITRQNPLNFEAREQMIRDAFPQVTIMYVRDVPSDEVWSRKLDDRIDDLTTPSQSVVLYGSRDSFISRYSGRHPTQELLQDTYVSGTQIRKAIAAASTVRSVDFRRGVVWAAYGQHPTCYSTVDVAVLDEDESRVLLARKPHESEYRFIGGFADPRSVSYEADARREVQEEAHIAITDPLYLASFLVDDWRYRGEVDVIKTLFFTAKLFSGSPRPDDDISDLRWSTVTAINPETEIVSAHRDMMRWLLRWHRRLHPTMWSGVPDHEGETRFEHDSGN